VLLVEQNAMPALEVENGRIVLEWPAAGLWENQEFKEFYLGLNEVAPADRIATPVSIGEGDACWFERKGRRWAGPFFAQSAGL
jgi:hypothetical protein